MEELQTLNLIKENESESMDRMDSLILIKEKETKVIRVESLLEKTLISKYKLGDYDAFTNIFTAYYKDLVRFASKFTHDISTAEEIVQETFVKFWEDHESVNICTSLKSYLLRMVQNKCIDWYRHKRIKQAHDNFVLKNQSRFELDTDNYILSSELYEQIEHALEKLPKGISEVFRMNRNDGLKYKEIADILGISVRTVEVRIGKALFILRDLLKEYFIVFVGFIISMNIFLK